MDLQNLTTKQKLILLGALALAVGVYFVISSSGMFSGRSIEGPSSNASDSLEVEDYDSTSESKRYYEITGQVNSPGVYESTSKVMVIELISLAGGLTEKADLYKIHKDVSLSALVEDRQKIYIPAIFEREMSASQGGGSSKSGSSGKVSLNSASSTELETLPDIGPATASKIIAARPYTKIEDLKNVQGIGEKTYNNIVSLIEP